jgi:cytochrome P450
MIDAVRAGLTGLTIHPRLLLYGFSRGAQMAQRFSMVYSGEVAAVATPAAGSYSVDRAQTSAAALADHGNSAELHVFSGAGHEETSAMRANACAFLASHADTTAG